MAYKDNVQKMCDRLGVANPVQEEDVLIERVVITGESGFGSKVQGTDMNRAGRLFLQECFSGPGFRATEVSYGTSFKEMSAIHFAELWQDAGNGKRSLIDAIHGGNYLQIFWKDS